MANHQLQIYYNLFVSLPYFFSVPDGSRLWNSSSSLESAMFPDMIVSCRGLSSLKSNASFVLVFDLVPPCTILIGSMKLVDHLTISPMQSLNTWPSSVLSWPLHAYTSITRTATWWGKRTSPATSSPVFSWDSRTPLPTRIPVLSFKCTSVLLCVWFSLHTDDMEVVGRPLRWYFEANILLPHDSCPELLLPFPDVLLRCCRGGVSFPCALLGVFRSIRFPTLKLHKQLLLDATLFEVLYFSTRQEDNVLSWYQTTNSTATF